MVSFLEKPTEHLLFTLNIVINVGGTFKIWRVGFNRFKFE